MRFATLHQDRDFEPVFRSHYASLCHFAWQILKDDSVVEDVVQDAFLSYLKNMDEISDHPTAIKNYLYTSVRHTCYNKLRSNTVKSRYLNLNPFVEGEEPSFVKEIIRAEVMSNVYKIISELPEGCQKIFRLGYLEGLSNEEISNELNISINTVKTQKMRGMRVLRAAFGPEALSWIMFFLMYKK